MGPKCTGAHPGRREGNAPLRSARRITTNNEEGGRRNRAYPSLRLTGSSVPSLRESLNALAQVDGLRVFGRTSSFSFKGRNEDLRTMGEKLGAAHILEGSVRKEGDRIRITAQLIEAAAGSHLWSKTFDRELKGVSRCKRRSRGRWSRRSIALDPAYAPAHVGLAQALGYLVNTEIKTPEGRTEGQRRALAEAERAIDLAPGLRRWVRRAWQGI